MEKWINDVLDEKVELMKLIRESNYFEELETVGRELSSTLRRGNKIILAGNGGSAADAQHFAAEIVGRFLKERNSLPAISLCVDPSIVTCIANDYGYDEVFSRQVSGLGKEGDVFIGISTSGNSKNILQALSVCKEKNIYSIGLTGGDGGKMLSLCDNCIVVPSKETARIQESHILIGHILCEIVENALFKQN